jgi:non-heme chloroperoxidase
MTRRDFVRATVGALFVPGAICTTVVADDVKRISVNGTELSYVEAGQGEPVIFVHGGLQDYRMWAEHLPKFAGYYRAIAYSAAIIFPTM